MKIEDVPFTIVDWSQQPAEEHKGETGFALWHDMTFGNVNVHLAEYSPDYRAANWCHMGHVLFVLEGTLITELKDGRTFTLTPGMSYQTSDSETNPHRSRTDTGARLFVVD